MLIKIDPILSPDLLFLLRSMGHGDKLVLADANFPAHSMNKNVVRLDGVNINEATRAILSVFPLIVLLSLKEVQQQIEWKLTTIQMN